MSGGTIRRALLPAFALAACLAGLSGSARALTDEEIFRNLPVNNLPPGPRAAAMGGAYVGIAGDATAPLTNPAGLHALSSTQIFLEFRALDPKNPEPFRSNVGSLAVDPVTGARELPYLSLNSASIADSQSDLSFIGFVWPLDLAGGKRRLRFEVSRQDAIHDHRTLPPAGDVTKAVFAFDTFPNTVSGGDVVAYSVSAPVTGSSSTEIVYWNGTVSWDLHPDFTVGLTLTDATLSLKSDTTTTADDPLQLYLSPTHPRLPGQPNTILYETHMDGTDSDLVYTLGLHWHPGSAFASGVSPWQFGAVYQKGARFSVEETTSLNQLPSSTFENQVNVPDRYAVGGSYRYGKQWLFALDLERVRYSQLADGFQTGVNFLTSPTVTGSFGIDPKKSVQFESSDGTLVRAGVEYLFPLQGNAERHLAFRGGFFRSPDDQVRMTEFNSQDPKVNAMYLDAFPGGKSTDHFTAGVGFTWAQASLEVAAETSDLGSQYRVGYILNLGKKH